MKGAILFFYLLYAQVTYGQDSFWLSMDTIIQDLRSKKSDTIMGLITTQHYYPPSIKVPGHDDACMAAEGYLFYALNSKYFIQKLVYYYYDECSTSGTSLSAPLELKNDSIFRQLRSSASQIRSDQLYPYIYTSIDPASNHIVYERLLALHSSQHSLRFYVGEEDTNKSINLADLEELST